MTAKPFAIGDRVRIVGSHPWRGYSGEITRTFSAPAAPDLKWIVAVDGSWSDAAVAEADIRHAAS